MYYGHQLEIVVRSHATRIRLWPTLKQLENISHFWSGVSSDWTRENQKWFSIKLAKKFTNKKKTFIWNVLWVTVVSAGSEQIRLKLEDENSSDICC